MSRSSQVWIGCGAHWSHHKVLYDNSSAQMLQDLPAGPQCCLPTSWEQNTCTRRSGKDATAKIHGSQPGDQSSNHTCCHSPVCTDTDSHTVLPTRYCVHQHVASRANDPRRYWHMPAHFLTVHIKDCRPLYVLEVCTAWGQNGMAQFCTPCNLSYGLPHILWLIFWSWWASGQVIDCPV